MYYIFLFDFGLAGVLLAGLSFFIWCWIAFKHEREMHPIYRESNVLAPRELVSADKEKCCA